MANWKQVTLTNAGRELAAAVTAGQLKLNITEIWFGSGTPANLETATDLAAKKIKADIVSIKQQDMECLITFRVSNEGQASAVVLSEMGFYAKGTSGSNILFSVTTDDQPATLPAQGSGPVYRQTMTMAFGYSNAENVEIDSTIIDGTPAEDVAAMIQEHDASSSAHQDIRGAIETAVDNHNTDAEAHKDFVGATAEKEGVRGMVPAPGKGANDRFLCADGSFKKAAMTTLEIVNIMYPVGMIVEFASDVDPNTVWPGTTWSKMDAGRVLVAAGEYSESGFSHTYTLGEKGGEAKHQLTTEELASHTHDATTSTNYANGQFSGMAGTISGVFSQVANQVSNASLDASSFYDRVAIKFEHNHSHNITIGNTGNNAPHENRMPYEAVQRWRRTA